MKNLIALSLLTLFGTSCSAQFPKSLKDAAKQVTGTGAGSGLTNADVVAGLKEAFGIGDLSNV